MAMTPRCRFWPKARQRPADYGPMCGMTDHSAAMPIQQPSSTIRRTARRPIPSGILPGGGASCRPMRMQGFNGLYDAIRQPGPVTEAGCWAQARRKFFELAELGKAPLAVDAVRRIDAIFTAEREINGQSADWRRAVRRARIAPLVADLEDWMRTTRAKLSRHADVAKAMDYMLKRWESFNRFLNDGRICLSTDGVEKLQASCGCSFLRFLSPGLHHSLVGALGTFAVVHFLVPDLLDPVVPT